MCYSSWLVFSDLVRVLDHTPNEHVLLLWTNRKLLDYVKIFVTLSILSNYLIYPFNDGRIGLPTLTRSVSLTRISRRTRLNY